MRKALLVSLLMWGSTTVCHAVVGSPFVFPGGSSGEGQYNSSGIFEGTPYFVVSTTTERVLVLSPPLGTPTSFAEYCSSASHVGRILVSSSVSAGQNMYVCTSSGVWSVQGSTSGGGGSPGGVPGSVQYNITNSSFGGSPLFYDSSTGRFGIYQTSPIGILHIGNVAGASSGNGTLVLAVDVSSGTSDGGHGFVDVSQLRSDTNDSYASIDLRAATTGYKNFNHMVGVQCNVSHTSSGTLDKLYELTSLPSNTGGQITDVYGLYLGRPGGSGIILNSYGIYAEDLVRGVTSNYLIYSPGLAQSLINGPVHLATGSVSAPSLTGPDAQTGIWFQSLGEINLTIKSTDFLSLHPTFGIVIKSTAISNGPGAVDVGSLVNYINTLFANYGVFRSSLTVFGETSINSIKFPNGTVMNSSPTVAAAVVTLPLPPGDTNYIQNKNSLQSNSTFYVSSATVQNNFLISDSDSQQVFGVYHTPLPRSGGIGPQTVETILNVASFADSGAQGTYQIRASTSISQNISPFTQDSIIILTPGVSPRAQFNGNGGLVSVAWEGLEQKSYDADSSNYVAERASNTVAANMTIIKPAAVGTVGQVRTIVSVVGDTVTENYQTPTGGGPPLYVSSVVALGSLSAVTAGTSAGSTVTISLFGGNTDYIQNTNSLQSNSTFFVSSATVQGTMTVVGNLAIMGNPCSGKTNGGALTIINNNVVCTDDDTGAGGAFTAPYISSAIGTYPIQVVTAGSVGSTITISAPDVSISSPSPYPHITAKDSDATISTRAHAVMSWNLTNTGDPTESVIHELAMIVNGSTSVYYTAYSTGNMYFKNDVNVPDEAYGAGWDGSLEVPTKNAVYDKIQTLGTGGAGSSSFTWTWNGEQMHVLGSSQPFISYSTGEAAGSVYFDETSTQAVTMRTILSHYNGNTLYLDVIYRSTATTGTINFGAYVECKTIGVDAIDGDTDSYDVINSSSVTVGGTANMLGKATITLTNNDSCAADDRIRIKLTREAGTSDTAVGFAKAEEAVLREN